MELTSLELPYSPLPLTFYAILKIKTFGLVSRIQDVEVGGFKNHNFLP